MKVKLIEFNEPDIRHMAVSLPLSVEHYRQNGDFENEIREIDRILAGRETSSALRKRLSLERVIALCMRENYLTDFDMLLSCLKEKYSDADERTLLQLTELGYADYILKNGNYFYENDALANIYITCSDFLERLDENKRLGSIPPVCYKGQNENARIMKERGGRAFRYTLTFKKILEGQYVKEGAALCIHLPFPAICSEQCDIELVSSSHPVYISKADQRTAFIKTPAKKNDEYSVTFSYTQKAVYTDLDPERAVKSDIAAHTGELFPHIRFTPFIKELAYDIAKDESNPLLQAKAVFDYITSNVNYSFMRPYLCLDNISEFALLNKRGDCGVQSIAFITLCRALGIPAVWQSGCAVYPEDGVSSHDWAKIYIAPYGWIPVDVSYAGGARRRGDEFIKNYYFGNLDPFRLVTSNDFQATFDPPKKFLREDPYDNQCGEIEYDSEALFTSAAHCSRVLESASEITDLYF